jgi:hypothetical protein
MDSETIYQAYPRHKDKRFALLAIEKAVRRIQRGEAGKMMSENQALSWLLDKTCEFSRSIAGQRGQMTPYPATWMNRGGYMDDPQEWDYVTPDEKKHLERIREANIGVWRPE